MANLINTTESRQCSSPLPELLALDDLAESIETWTTQMNAVRPGQAGGDYGNDYE